MPAYRLLLVDDHSSIRLGLRMLLESAGFDVVGEAGGGSAGVRLAKSLNPDVVLMDIRMTEGNGIQATKDIVSANAGKVLVISAFDLSTDVVEAIRAGAKGYVLKTLDAEELIRSVTDVAEGRNVLDATITAAVMENIAHSPQPAHEEWPPKVLTPREVDVLECIGEGQTNRAISRSLGMAETTVKTHISNALGKLQLSSRVEAAIYVASRRKKI